MDNQQIFLAIFSLHNQLPGITPFMVAVTNYSPYISFILITLMALHGQKKERKALILATLGLLITFPTISLIHLFIQEPRPFITLHFSPLIPPPNSFTFPSGHSATLAVATSALFFIRSRWTLGFAAWALLVGFSRIYLGVHYPLDVLGGFVLGFTATFLAGFFLNMLQKALRI